jgi:hypothetical protein
MTQMRMRDFFRQVSIATDLARALAPILARFKLDASIEPGEKEGSIVITLRDTQSLPEEA